MTEPQPPYGEVFVDLLKSVMRAQSEVVEALATMPLARVRPALINRHFSWLALAFDEGENRHLFESSTGGFPLRTRGLRSRSHIPPDSLRILEARSPLPISHAATLSTPSGASSPLVQRLPTRISNLVKASFVSSTDSHREKGRKPAGLLSEADGISIRSPLSVVFEYLTIPTVPGSNAYALVPLRNYLFEAFNIYPSDVGGGKRSAILKVADVEAALSHIWTSFRVRHYSRGQDPLPAEGRGHSGGLLRHFLAATDVLWLRFSSASACLRYLQNASLRPDEPSFEFVRSVHLDRLPELGELINQLWGLPLPIRGADTIFRGGLKFSSRQGLVVGIHGGPGSGKTSVALALGATLAPLGIRTLFITAEETTEDLDVKAQALVCDEFRRLSFFPKSSGSWLDVQPLSPDLSEEFRGDTLHELKASLSLLSKALSVEPVELDTATATPKPCRAIVVLDGVHDLIMASHHSQSSGRSVTFLQELRQFVLACRELRALVLLTAGEDWAGDRALDYLVDVALRLNHESVAETGQKPDRKITLSKARHQLCAVGSHGVQIAGIKGVRFSPQINYQLDRRAHWRTRTPDMSFSKQVLTRAIKQDQFDLLSRRAQGLLTLPGLDFRSVGHGVRLFRGSNIFLNGEGSSGKAALALKMAISPDFADTGKMVERPERVLIVSFLYPAEYYENIKDSLLKLRKIEYGVGVRSLRPTLHVIHLYPGFYRADQLFNRVEWELDSAELNGEPYTAIVVDGLHNVFLQFPEIEKYTLFWPQLYASLRSRSLTIISTHTTFVLQGAAEGEDYRLDDRRSEPLRHALVQKTDFRFEIDPVVPDRMGQLVRSRSATTSNIFSVKTVAAINQTIPGRDLFWSRESLVLFESGQSDLPFDARGEGSSAR